MKVSVFTNFNIVSENIEILEILEQIRSDKYKNRILQFRSLLASVNIAEYNKQKRSLPAFTPSALFEGGRKIEFLKEYSNLLILDIDKLQPDQVPVIKQKIQECIYTYSVFISPSGCGLKILIHINSNIDQHKQIFNKAQCFYESLLNIPIDPSGKDVTRLCFLSWDPAIYINNNSSIFPPSTLSEAEGYITIQQSIPEQIESVINQIELNQIDITNSYQDWLRLAFALIDALGSNAREPFHRISRFYHKYNPSECDAQFDKCLKSKNSGTTIKTFFFYAQSHGININPAIMGIHTNNTNFTPLLHKSNESAKIPSLSAAEMTALEKPNKIEHNEIAGKQTDEKPKKRKSGTNKFHLVRDYLTENFDIRYNSVSTNFEYKEKHESDYEPMNENDIFIKMQLDGLSFSLTNLVAFLKSSMVSKYNPFTQYFESLPPWDGETDYIQNLASFVNLKPEVRGRFDNHFKKWLVRVVKCALLDNYFNKQAFILVHDKQNSGKSTFCRFLCPPKLKNYIAENLSIDKDSRILLTTNLLINLDELSTLSKVEINSLKSLFSKDKINDRLPYDRKNSIIPRRASFIGSTNQAEFLNDESGSVRWLCFVIESIDWSYKEKINMDHVWAQAYNLFKTNFQCDMTHDEIKENEEYNIQFQISTSERELIEKLLSPASKEQHSRFMSATDILIYLSEKTDNRIKLNASVLGKALKFLGFQKERQGHFRVHGYYVNFRDDYLWQ